MSTAPAGPVRVRARLDPGLSRWLWLFKVILAIPHYVVLVFLWAAFVVLTVAAFFAILFTERYPRSIFEFNVGVMRWSWRVAYYSYGALGTDRYPPFSLGAEPDYPATLDVEYPEQLSRGLALVKWWLLALPHYLVVGILVGSGVWLAGEPWTPVWGGGLITALALVAGLMLLLRGQYPAGIFDLVLGLNRWVLRVAAYASLMTDTYPPFRLDMGGDEPGAVAVPDPAPAAAATPRPPLGAARALLAVLAALVALGGLGVMAGGATLVIVDRFERDDAGYLMSPSERFVTPTYAFLATSDDPDVLPPGDVGLVRDVLGTVKVTAESVTPVFVGVGPLRDVAAYLAGVDREELRGLTAEPEDRVLRAGRAPDGAPGAQDFWLARSTSGELTWKLADGDYAIAVMNADGSAAIDADLAIGAEADGLGRLGAGLILGGLLVLGGAGLLTFAAVRRS